MGLRPDLVRQPRRRTIGHQARTVAAASIWRKALPAVPHSGRARRRGRRRRNSATAAPPMRMNRREASIDVALLWRMLVPTSLRRSTAATTLARLGRRPLWDAQDDLGIVTSSTTAIATIATPTRPSCRDGRQANPRRCRGPGTSRPSRWPARPALRQEVGNVALERTAGRCSCLRAEQRDEGGDRNHRLVVAVPTRHHVEQRAEHVYGLRRPQRTSCRR